MASLALRLIGVVCGRGQALSKVEANRPANARGAFAAPVEISIRWKRSGSGGAFVRGIRRREPNRGNSPKGFGRRRPASGKKKARPPCSALRSPAEAWSGSRASGGESQKFILRHWSAIRSGAMYSNEPAPVPARPVAGKAGEPPVARIR